MTSVSKMYNYMPYVKPEPELSSLSIMEVRLSEMGNRVHANNVQYQDKWTPGEIKNSIAITLLFLGSVAETMAICAAAVTGLTPITFTAVVLGSALAYGFYRYKRSGYDLQSPRVRQEIVDQASKILKQKSFTDAMSYFYDRGIKIEQIIDYVLLGSENDVRSYAVIEKVGAQYVNMREQYDADCSKLRWKVWCSYVSLCFERLIANQRQKEANEMGRRARKEGIVVGTVGTAVQVGVHIKTERDVERSARRAAAAEAERDVGVATANEALSAACGVLNGYYKTLTQSSPPYVAPMSTSTASGSAEASSPSPTASSTPPTITATVVTVTAPAPSAPPEASLPPPAYDGTSTTATVVLTTTNGNPVSGAPASAPSAPLAVLTAA